MVTLTRANLRAQAEQELTENILPFWMNHTVDHINGGFYGAVTNELEVHNEEPRSAVLCARILWTFSTAYRRLGNEQYLSMARWAYDYLTRVFVDQEYGGVYWQVDFKGQPIADSKHHYAQAFAIYGLSEYYRATHEAASLELAQELYRLLEEHAYDPVNGGYIEASNRQWGSQDDMRLSELDLNSRKSMNTLLHILEAYTNLLRVWDDPTLRAQHRKLIDTFLQYVIDPATGHFNLFFDDEWHSLSDVISFGHDIEGSWLLMEAAEAQGDAALMNKVREAAINMATAVYDEGLDDDGSVFMEANTQGWLDTTKAWWVEAESVVGFYNAFQASGQPIFEEAAYRCWIYIQEKMVDRTHGDWFKQLHRDGTPDSSRYKVSAWDCPYHHSRVCFELMDRLGEKAAL